MKKTFVVKWRVSSASDLHQTLLVESYSRDDAVASAISTLDKFAEIISVRELHHRHQDVA